jgi:hypothetical protein
LISAWEGNVTSTTTRQRDLSISAADKLRCAERELKYRARTYPRLVEQHKMGQATADREIAIMKEIAADMRAQAEAERML